MDSDPRRAELKRRFHEALALPAVERQRWLAGLADRVLAQELKELLDAHLAADTEFLHAPPAQVGGSLDPAALGLERGWRVLRELARGGMGVVYLAERADGAYQQQVALKLLRPDAWVTPESLLRLKLERQILARLQHPNIARLLDGGTTASGAPYLVMEFIDGERVDLWCTQQGAKLEQRLQLFLKICSAVACAHRNLVVHRDLKPGNILVDAGGEPKLLDFGIAREVASDSSLTRAGERLLTPRYASPEQMRAQPATTLSDIYSLGVLLYELLAGASPYAVEEDDLPALMDAVCQQPVATPSARARQLSPGRAPLPPARLRGDLDAIVLKCMAKTPSARYASVEALIEDLQAVLDGGPVAARRGHRWYTLRNLARRHWMGLSVAGLVMVLSALFVLRLDQQLRETERVRDQQARTLAFITDLFRIADPGEARGNAVTVREVLDRGAALLSSEANLDPAVRADLLATLGLVYRQLGLLADSERTVRSGLGELEALDGGVRARLHLELAATAIEQAHWDVAAESLNAARVQIGAAAASDARLQFLDGYLALRRGRFAEAEPPLERALALLRTRQPPPLRQIAESLLALGNIARDRGDYALSEARILESLRLLESAGADPWSLARVHNNLAILSGDRGDYAAAERAALRAHELIESVLGAQHPAAATALLNVASMKSRQGDHAQAAQLFRQVLDVRIGSLGAEHPQTLAVRANLGYIEFAQGRYRAAQDELSQALEGLQRVLGGGHLMAASARRNLVAVAFAEGRIEAARAENARLLAAADTLGNAQPLLLQARVRELAYACLTGPECAAEPLLAAVAAHEAKLGAGHAEVGESLAWQAALEALGALGESCGPGGAASRLDVAGKDVAPWDRELWSWGAARCAKGEEQPALAALRDRYGDAHPLLRRLSM